MKVRSLSKRLDALSAQHGGKIPFGSMKGASKDKGKGKTTRRRGNKSKKQRHTSKASRRKRSKKASKPKSQPKHKGEPSMSPKHIGENVIHRGEDGDLYKVKREKGETWGKWIPVDFKTNKP